MVRSFEEQSDSGGGQFFSTVGTRMFSTSLQVPVLFLSMRSKMKDPRPIIVTLHTDNCPSTEDGPTVTQLNPKLLQHTPTRRTTGSTSSRTVVPTSPQLFVIAASHPQFTTLNIRTHLSTVFPTACHRLFVTTTLCADPVYQSE